MRHRQVATIAAVAIMLLSAVAPVGVVSADAQSNTYLGDEADDAPRTPDQTVNTSVEYDLIYDGPTNDGADPSIDTIGAQSDDEYVYFEITYAGNLDTAADLNTAIFLDVDQSQSTGLVNDTEGWYYMADIGADYAAIFGQEGPGLWEWDDSSSTWEDSMSLANSQLNPSSNTLELVIEKNKIEDPDAIDLIVGNGGPGEEWAPPKGEGSLTVDASQTDAPDDGQIADASIDVTDEMVAPGETTEIVVTFEAAASNTVRADTLGQPGAAAPATSDSDRDLVSSNNTSVTSIADSELTVADTDPQASNIDNPQSLAVVADWQTPDSSLTTYELRSELAVSNTATDGETITFDSLISAGSDELLTEPVQVTVDGDSSDIGEPDTFEPNNDFDTAADIEPGEYTNLEIDPGGESDFFAVDVGAGTELGATIDFSHATGDIDLAVYGPQQNQIENSVSVSDGESVSVVADEAGTHYIEVYGFAGASAPYDLTVTTDGIDNPPVEGEIEDASISVTDETVTPGETTEVVVTFEATATNLVAADTVGNPDDDGSSTPTSSSDNSNDRKPTGTNNISAASIVESELSVVNTAPPATQTQNGQLAVEAEWQDPAETLTNYELRSEVVISDTATDGETITFDSSILADQDSTLTDPVELTVDSEDTGDGYSAANAVAIDNEGDVGYVIEEGTIVAFDMSTREEINTFSAPDGTDKGLAYGAGSLWYSDAATDAFDGRILELDPETGAVRSQIDVGYDPYGLAFGDGSLWAGEVTGIPNNVYEFSPNGEQIGSFDISGPASSNGPNGLAYYNDSVWVGTQGTLVALDLDGNIEQSIENNDLSYSGLGATDTALYGPDENGELTVLVGEESDDGSDDPVPDPGTGEVAATLEPTAPQVGLGGESTVELVVTGPDAGVGSYEFTVSVGDASTVEIADIQEANTGGTGEVNLASDGSSVSVNRALLGDTIAPTDAVVLATLTVSGEAAGTTDLTVEEVIVGDEGGNSYDVVGTGAATLEVTEGVDVTGDGNPATDTTGDGKLNDIDGDGEANILDVQAFFNSLDDEAVQNNPELFDFNGDGEVSIIDVQALFNQNA